MFPAEIRVGGTYHDGKSGLRKVVSIDGRPLHVRYEILAAKAHRALDRDLKYVSILGTESRCNLESFARWAIADYEGEGAQRTLFGLMAAKIKLSPGESAFLVAVQAGADGAALDAGSVAPYEPADLRAVSGLEKKGILQRVGDDEVEFSALGAARLLSVLAA